MQKIEQLIKEKAKDLLAAEQVTGSSPGKRASCSTIMHPPISARRKNLAHLSTTLSAPLISVNI